MGRRDLAGRQRAAGIRVVTTAEQRRERIKLLRLQITINRMVPDSLRCDDAIAEMEAEIAQLERRHLSIVDRNSD